MFWVVVVVEQLLSVTVVFTEIGVERCRFGLERRRGIKITK